MARKSPAPGAKAKPVTLSTSTSSSLWFCTNSDTYIPNGRTAEMTSLKTWFKGFVWQRAPSLLMLTGHSVVINIFTFACSIIANRVANLTGWNEKCVVSNSLPGSILAVSPHSLELTNTFKKGHHRTPYSRRYFTMQQILAMFSGHVSKMKIGALKQAELAIC